MLFVDGKTRTLVANQPDAEGLLTRSRDVFVGTLPAMVQVANTAMDWVGVKWTMIVLPLPEDKYPRSCGRLLMLPG
jgi:hypothetical protein